MLVYFTQLIKSINPHYHFWDTNYAITESKKQGHDRRLQFFRAYKIKRISRYVVKKWAYNITSKESCCKNTDYIDLCI